ncbi:MAG: SWIM zinc finger family protein [Candidatus Schekmanbacteria bacterium]|nr:SWIM zinc finger family protein [Candidatus Schekmanbacteria bacterium]
MPRKWVSLGTDVDAAWGECQGSANDPYQTRIDLSEPAFKCSCPSRKFPCKHALGLFLLLAQQPAVFSQCGRPDWVDEWLGSRRERAEKKEQRREAGAAAAAADPAAQARRAAEQARRAEAREDKVARGLDELDRFLRDLVRQGLATVRDKPYSFWDAPAARLVDAQAPGLARRLQELAGVASADGRWQEKVLERLGRLHVIIEGYRHIAALPSDMQADLRAAIGFTVPQEDVLSGTGVRDQWLVLGQRVHEEDRLRTQRTWLWGQACRRAALILHFAPAGQPLDISLVPGTALAAEVVYFPASYPQRALIKTRLSNPRSLSEVLPAPRREREADGNGHGTVATALARCAEALATQPLLETFPLWLETVVPVRIAGGWNLRDEDGRLMPLERGCGGTEWMLAALSGNAPIDVFGEWDGDALRALSAWVDGRLVRCSWPDPVGAQDLEG